MIIQYWYKSYKSFECYVCFEINKKSKAIIGAVFEGELVVVIYLIFLLQIYSNAIMMGNASKKPIELYQVM